MAHPQLLSVRSQIRFHERGLAGGSEGHPVVALLEGDAEKETVPQELQEVLAPTEVRLAIPDEPGHPTTPKVVAGPDVPAGRQEESPEG